MLNLIILFALNAILGTTSPTIDAPLAIIAVQGAFLNCFVLPVLMGTFLNRSMANRMGFAESAML